MKTDQKLVRNKHTVQQRRFHGFGFVLTIGAVLWCAFGASAAGESLRPKIPKPPTVQNSNAPPRVIEQRVDPRFVIDFRGLGGEVYATGLAPIQVQMMHTLPGLGPHPKGPTYPGRIYLIADGRKLLLGSNYENKPLNLGVFAPGELQIVIENATESFVASTGPAERNADNLPHGIVRETNGVVEVHMEMTPRLVENKLLYGSASDQNYARENYFGDVHLYFKGGVTADPDLPKLINALKSGDIEEQKAAAESLAKNHPELTRSIGLPRAAPSPRK